MARQRDAGGRTPGTPRLHTGLGVTQSAVARAPRSEQPAAGPSLGVTRGIQQTSQASLPPHTCLLHPSSPCLTTLMVSPARGEPHVSQGSRHPAALPAPAGREPARSCREPAGAAAGLKLQRGKLKLLFIYGRPDPIHQALGTSRVNEILLPPPYLHRGGPLPKHACVKEGL